MAITPLPTAPTRADPTNFSTRADAFMTALPTFATECNATAVAMTLNATNSTSTASLAIGLGSKSLTVQTAKSYVVGMTVKIASTASPTNWMLGDVTAYTTGTGALVVTITAIQGSGTIASWNVMQSVPGLQTSGFRNALINGNFGVNQRAVTGTVTLAAGAYGHDRWKAGASGCTYTFATALNVTTLTISAGTLIQVIEGINLQSNTYTLSWTGTATGKIGAGVLSASGISGAVVGGTNLNIEFSTGTLSKVQFKEGIVNSAFEMRPYGMELALCQRYCQSFDSSNGAMAIGSSGFYGDTANISFSTSGYGTKMRTYLPTVTTTGTQPTDFGVSTSAGIYQSGFTFTASSYGSVMSAQKTTHGLTPSACFIGIQTSTGRITLSSEL